MPVDTGLRSWFRFQKQRIEVNDVAQRSDLTT